MPDQPITLPWDSIEAIPTRYDKLGIRTPPAEPRALTWLRHYGRKLPGIWDELDALRRNEYKAAPHPWCYVSVAAARTLVARKIIVHMRGSDGAVAVSDPGAPARARRDAYDGAVLAALAAWRMGKGVYRFDPDVYDALWATEIAPDDPLPSSALYALPEWCVYVQPPVPGPGPMDTGDPNALRVHGIFAHLTPLAPGGAPPAREAPRRPVKDARGAAAADPHPATLRLLFDVGIGDGTPSARAYLLPYALPLGPSLAASLQAVQDPADVHNAVGASTGISAAWHRELRHGGTASEETVREMADLLGPFVSLVLYLCTSNAEIRAAGASHAGAQPANPAPTKVKGGTRLFPAGAVRTWDVAFRLGAALRRARAEAAADAATPADPAGPGDPARARPRPHLRRAHFHTYWRGPLHDPTARTAEVRWLPPIAVNVGDAGADVLPATVRRVL